MYSPWAGGVDSTKGRQFWFYDANDKLIANDSTCSSDNKYLMTIPEGAVYMRFLGFAYNKEHARVAPLYKTLMVTEGEEEYI
jgi:hypothetical protein